MLKSDSQGFLTGVTVTDIHRATEQLIGIRADIKAIKAALLGTSNTGTKASKRVIEKSAKISVVPSSVKNKPSRKAVTPTRSKSDKTPVLLKTVSTKTVTPTVSVKPSVTKAPNTPATANTVALVRKAITPKALTPAKRDASGRFVKKTQAELDAGRDKKTGRFTSNGKDGDGIESRKDRGVISDLASRLANVAAVSANSVGSLENADPSVMAAKEVVGAVTPVMQGYRTLFGGGDKKERWYSKIFKEISLSRKENSVFSKAQNKVLKNIDDKPVGGGDDSDGGQSFLGGLLGSISPMVMTAITGIGGALLAGISAVLGTIFSPIALAIGSAAGVAWIAFTDEGHKFFRDITDKISTGWDKVVNWFIESSPITMGAIKKGTDSVKSGVDSVKRSSPRTTEAISRAWNGVNKSIGDVLRGGESGKEGYNAYNRGTGLGSNGHRDLTNMSIEEIQAAQALPRSDKARMMAVGKYQMMPSTLKEGAAALNLDSGTKFNEATQERLFSEFLVGKKRPEIRDYITGKSDNVQAAQIAGAKEWRSIADPRTGKTYADNGATGNKASITADEWQSSMDTARKQYQDNINLGLTQKEAYSKAVTDIQVVVAKAPAVEAEKQKIETAQTVAENAIPALHNLAAGQGANQTQNFSATSPRIPSFSAVAPVAEAPQVVQPLSGSQDRNMTVTMPSADIGRDLKDRGIAHIVSGGLSGGY